jgi:hypothetical protein
MILLAACWHIGKRRNEIIFEEAVQSISVVEDVVINRIQVDVSQ